MNVVPSADSTYAGGRRGKECAARHERSNDWRRGAQRPRPGQCAPPTFRGIAAGRSAQRGTNLVFGGPQRSPDPSALYYMSVPLIDGLAALARPLRAHVGRESNGWLAQHQRQGRKVARGKYKRPRQLLVWLGCPVASS